MASAGLLLFSRPPPDLDCGRSNFGETDKTRAWLGSAWQHERQRKMNQPTAARRHQGLSESDARNRLRIEGLNSLPTSERRTLVAIAAEIVREPMLLLLLGGGALYLALGDLKEGLILFMFAMLSIIIAIVQETRTERVLEALRALSSPRALVVRDGEQRRIPGSDVVRGDLLVLGEGERTAADGFLLEAHDLLADESLLTGESVPVRKVAASGAPDAAARPGGDDLPFVFSGSLMVRGSGLAEVTATGPRSAIGRIGQSLASLEREPPRLRAQTARMVRILAPAGAIVSLLTAVLYGLSRGDWLAAALAGIAIGMSMLPEELPVVLTVFMAMGAWRISKARVLTRRAAAIEALGSATVLCTDKTGTLTENRMRVAQLRLASGEILKASFFQKPSPSFAELLLAARRASARNPVDPMERAFHDAAEDLAPGEKEAHLVHAFGLRPDMLAVTHLWRMGQGPELLVTAKGAPETIADLCGLPAEAKVKLKASVDAMAMEGLRVLGVARGKWFEPSLPVSPRAVTFEFLGLAGLADPIRANVPAAVRDCRSAGIRVIMVTGDYPATAAAIGRQAGLDAEAVISGPELQELDDAGLSAAVAKVCIFARVAPEQKLRIVQALKANGEIIAMTGDGVNDAPSLKAAHIGIAMGGRGTDVAREASSIVLLDDDFSSIVQAVRLGRRIYDNLRKAAGFIFAVHVPVAGLALVPLIAGLPPLLGPVHIAFLEMIIDPVCSLAFEAEHAEKNVMQRPPRPPQETLFSRALLAWGLLQGLFAFGVVVASFFIATARGMPEDEIRALCFFALVASIVALIFVNRSFGASPLDAVARPSLALVCILAVVVCVLAGSLSIGAIADLFRFGPLHSDDLAIVIGAALLMVVGLEMIKLLRNRLFGATRMGTA